MSEFGSNSAGEYGMILELGTGADMFTLQRKCVPRRGLLGPVVFALIVSVVSLVSAEPSFATGRTLTAKYVSDSLTANYINRLAEERAFHARDIQIADDNRRQLEEASAQNLAAASARVNAAVARNERLRQATDRERALRQQAEQELTTAREAFVQAANDYAAELANRDIQFKAMVAAYRNEISRIADEASPEKRELLQRFSEGDNTAFAALDAIASANVAARNAANGADLRLMANLAIDLYYRGGTSIADVTARFDHAISEDPVDVGGRLSLCLFQSHALYKFGPDVEEQQLQPANATCRAQLSAVSEADRIPFYKVLASNEKAMDRYDDELSTHGEVYALLDRMIAGDNPTVSLLDSIFYFASDAAIAAKGKERLQLQSARSTEPLTREQRKERQRQEDKAQAAMAAPYLKQALVQVESLRARIGSAPSFAPRYRAALEKFGNANVDDNHDLARAAYELMFRSASAELAKSPSDDNAIEAFGNSLELLADVRITNTAERLVTKRRAITVWRDALSRDPQSRRWKVHLADSLIQLTSVVGDLSPEEQVAASAEAVALRRAVSDAVPDDRDDKAHLGEALESYGSDLSDAARFEEAKVAYNEALRIFRSLAARFPRVGRFRESVESCIESLQSLEEMVTIEDVRVVEP